MSPCLTFFVTLALQAPIHLFHNNNTRHHPAVLQTIHLDAIGTVSALSILFLSNTTIAQRNHQTWNRI